MDNTKIQENSNYRILIVDDTPKNIQLLGTILREEGYQLNAAENGLQVFDVLESVTPDLILLDVMMPDRDGIALLKDIQEMYPDVPVVMVSASTSMRPSQSWPPLSGPLRMPTVRQPSVS